MLYRKRIKATTRRRAVRQLRDGKLFRVNASRMTADERAVFESGPNRRTYGPLRYRQCNQGNRRRLC